MAADTPPAAPEPSRPAVPRSITLHVSPHIREVDPEGLVADLRSAARAVPEILIRGDLLADAQAAGRRPDTRKAAVALATGRVRSAYVAHEYLPAAPGEEAFEMQVDGDAAPAALASLAGRMYDGERAARAALPLIAPAERATDRVHVWATRRLLVTYSTDDYRYHARYAVHGYPTVFSVLALRYAPAPSREAELHGMALLSRGVPREAAEEAVAQAFAGEAFDPSDTALVTRALASATLQACARAAGLAPFCEDARCRLYNPHRRPEFIRSILGASVCARHRGWFCGDP